MSSQKLLTTTEAVGVITEKFKTVGLTPATDIKVFLYSITRNTQRKSKRRFTPSLSFTKSSNGTVLFDAKEISTLADWLIQAQGGK
jgi:hypothetical protein